MEEMNMEKELDCSRVFGRLGFSVSVETGTGNDNCRIVNGKLYTIHRMNDVPNKCESCDAFDDCYMIGIGMKDFCKQEEFNAVYKRVPLTKFAL